MEITVIPKEGISKFWSTVEPMIKSALDRAPGRWQAVDVLIELMADRQVLWGVIEEDKIVAAYTTRVSDVPAGRICTVEWLGGERMYEWIDDAVEMTEAYARDMKCTRIEAHGRKGWKKFLNDHGWKELAVTYDKDLTNG